eukprot:3513884-Rhodomonas_salina.3
MSAIVRTFWSAFGCAVPNGTRQYRAGRGSIAHPSVLSFDSTGRDRGPYTLKPNHSTPDPQPETLTQRQKLDPRP